MKVQKTTPQDSMGKAAEPFCWTIFIASVESQSLLLVTSTLGTVLPVEKILVSGVTVSDNYNLFATVAYILHLCTFCTQNVYSTTKELLVRAKTFGRACNGLCTKFTF